MTVRYNQLSLQERTVVKRGLDDGLSFREIARLLGRSASTVSREVHENRIPKATKAKKKTECRDKGWCKRIGVCAKCVREGAQCAGCDARDCRDYCRAYAEQSTCQILSKAPWVCNSCRKLRYGCHRANRWVYDAQAAHKAACERRSESRQGIDMPKEKAEVALSYIKDGLTRGLSPYEISVSCEDTIGVHRSTIYRWVEAGYGGLTNLELERKVGFKPRNKTIKGKSTSHTPKRSYAEFLKLPDDERRSATEMDTVIGCVTNSQCALTLLFPPAALQLWLLTTHDTKGTLAALKAFKEACPEKLYSKLARIMITDNGEEFADEDSIAAIFDEDLSDHVSLYYCDPRHSEQKPRCEKNHSEGRQLLAKGMFDFDELTKADMRVVMCHVNSNPRLSLGGLSPIQAFLAIYGEEGAELLNAFGIEQIPPSKLMLKPEILDIERAHRGEPPLTKLK